MWYYYINVVLQHYCSTTTLMIQLLLTTACTARMTADARGGEPRRGESDGTSSISRASDDRGFPGMPAEASRGEVNQTEPHRFPALWMTIRPIFFRDFRWWVILVVVKWFDLV